MDVTTIAVDLAKDVFEIAGASIAVNSSGTCDR